MPGRELALQIADGFLDLVTINDGAEEAWLALQLDFGRFWIGLTDDGSEGAFRWLTGEPVRYTRWDDGEPGLEGWTVYLDANGNGQLDPDERSTTTGANGDYTLAELPACCRVLR